MTDKELQRLGRRDLIEILCRLKRENIALNDQIQQLQTQLSNRTLKIKKAGTLAEAAISVNGVLEAAQKAADQYLEEIRRTHANIEKDCTEMITQTKDECQRREEEADIHINEKWKELEQKAESYIRTHSELEALLDTNNDAAR